MPISIDTIKPAVARAAVRAGASIINDIAANREDEEMWRLAAGKRRGLCVDPHARHAGDDAGQSCYKDVVAEVNEFFEERLERLLACGVNANRWCWTWGLVLASGWRTICGCWRGWTLLQNGSARCCWALPANRSWAGVGAPPLEERLPGLAGLRLLGGAAGRGDHPHA